MLSQTQQEAEKLKLEQIRIEEEVCGIAILIEILINYWYTYKYIMCIFFFIDRTSSYD